MKVFILAEYKRDDLTISLARCTDNSYVVIKEDIITYHSSYEWALADFYEEVCEHSGAIDYITSPDSYITI
jgi:hypothetical protein